MEEEVKFLFNNIEYKINKKYKYDIDNFINEYFIGLNKYWVGPLSIFNNININEFSFYNIVKNKIITTNFLKNYKLEYKFFNRSIYYLIASINKYFDDRKMNYDYGCKLSCYNKKNLQKEKDEEYYIEYIKQNKQFDYEDNYKNNICFFNNVIKLLEDLKRMFSITEEEYYIFKKIILIYLYITIRLILLNTSFTYKSDFYNMINEIKDFIFNNYNIKILLKNNKEFIQKNYCLSVKYLSEPKAEVCNILNRGLTVNICEDKIYFYNNTEDGYINYQSQELLQGGHNYKEKYLKYKLKYLNLKNKH